jgi:hypothetical protein
MPYEVVAYPGTDQQSIVAGFDLASQAYAFVRSHPADDLDVMKRLLDGTLTTEF